MQYPMPAKPMVATLKFFDTVYTIVRLPCSNNIVYIQEDDTGMHMFTSIADAAIWLADERAIWHSSERDARMQEIVEEKVEKLLNKVEAEMDYMTFGGVEATCQHLDTESIGEYDDYAPNEFIDVTVVMRISLADIFEQARCRVNHG